MTTDRPPPGSAWARHCPDAYPAEWLDALGLTALPPGFARFATPDEVAVITGASVEVARPPTRHPTPSPRPPAAPGAGNRWRVLNDFLDGTMRGLTFGEAKVWLLLFRDARGGVARTGQADLARRSGLTVRGVQKVLPRLRAKGLLSVVRRGGLGTGPSTYRVHPP